MQLLPNIKNRYQSIGKNKKLISVLIFLPVLVSLIMLVNYIKTNTRKNDLTRIADAVYKYSAENNGHLPDTDNIDSQNSFPKKPMCIGTSSECFNLAEAGSFAPKLKIVPNYLPSMPVTPGSTQENTGYTIYKDTNGRIVLGVSDNKALVIR